MIKAFESLPPNGSVVVRWVGYNESHIGRYSMAPTHPTKPWVVDRFTDRFTDALMPIVCRIIDSEIHTKTQDGI